MTVELAELQFISNMGDLLLASENATPTMTATNVFQLPATTQLQERFAMTFAGPEARVLAEMMARYYIELVQHVKQKKPSLAS